MRVKIWLNYTFRVGAQVLNEIAHQLNDNSGNLKRYHASKDKLLRFYEKNLNPDSVVLDVGGYKGRWASEIYSMYRPKIYIFEPIPEYTQQLKKKYKKNVDITVIPSGLADKTCKLHMRKDGESSSIFSNKGEKVKVKMIGIDDFLESQKLTFISLMKINIEGGEYDLLKQMIEGGSIKKVKEIQVQFHNITPSSNSRMKKLRLDLSRTHKKNICL